MGSFKTIRKSRCSARPSDPRLALALRALKHVEFLMQTAEAALKSVPRVVAKALFRECASRSFGKPVYGPSYHVEF